MFKEQTDKEYSEFCRYITKNLKYEIRNKSVNIKGY